MLFSALIRSRDRCSFEIPIFVSSSLFSLFLSLLYLIIFAASFLSVVFFFLYRADNYYLFLFDNIMLNFTYIFLKLMDYIVVFLFHCYYCVLYGLYQILKFKI